MAIGLYLHIPFCVSKCPYCDFYSLIGSTDAQREAYVQALVRTMKDWSERTGETADTLYFGGGTPSLLGGKRLTALIAAARQYFGLTSDAEITLEANPADGLDEVFAAFAATGGNRVSLGMQASTDEQLRLLGRRHTTAQVETAVTAAHKAGIDNLSLDLMLGTSGQSPADVQRAVRCCADLGATHVSAYLLKLEPHTPYAVTPPPLPDEETTVALYHTAAEALESAGYRQYEISNFARDGKCSRHNLKYWNLDPYIGLGPAAHSFYGGKRFYYPRSLDTFMTGTPPLAESEEEVITENSPEEYAMLRLRLTEGLTEEGFAARFGYAIPSRIRERAAALPTNLITTDKDGIRLTRDGFLVSDAILAQLLL